MSNLATRTLSDVMEFEHVIRVHSDGTVTDAEPTAPHAPEVWWFEGSTDTDEQELAEPWTLMRGYTGQYGYSGHCMHSSELIGGRLERDILAAPGLYVAVAVESVADCCELEAEPAGWAIAHIPA